MKRKGFTLIELMVVIAIIIILAAVAIPNYINMTKRAKKSRVAHDMANLATALELYKNDWGCYPYQGESTGKDVSSPDSNLRAELGGVIPIPEESESYAKNVPGAMNETGEVNPPTGNRFSYMKDETLQAIKNPFYPEEGIRYVTNDNAGEANHYCLYAKEDTTDYTGAIFKILNAYAYIMPAGDHGTFIYRTDSMSSIRECKDEPIYYNLDPNLVDSGD